MSKLEALYILSREKFPTKYFFEGNLAYQRKFYLEIFRLYESLFYETRVTLVSRSQITIFFFCVGAGKK